MADFGNSYGLDPSIVSYLQGGDQQLATDPTGDGIIHGGAPALYASAQDPQNAGVLTRDIVIPPRPPPPPPPPPPQNIGPAMGGGQEVPDYGLPGPVVAGVQSGFAPLPDVTGLPGAVAAPDIAPTRQTAPDVSAATVDDAGAFSPASAPNAHIIPGYDRLGAERPLGPGEWIKNKNGSWSNEITSTVEDKNLNGGKPTVVPTLWMVDGKPTTVSEDEAARLAATSGLKFPSFSTMKDAEKFANARESNWQNVPEGATRNVPALWQEQGLPSSVAANIQNGFVPDRADPRQSGPDFLAGTVATPTDAQIKASNAAVDKRQAAQAAFDASPEGMMQKSDAMRADAVNKQDAADKAATDAQVIANNAIAVANQKAAARTAERDQAELQAQKDFAANRDKLVAEKNQAIDNYVNYKVDTDRDVGARGLIAIALSGIGDALDHHHGPNAAAQILDAQADKRIADQWKQKDELGKKAGFVQGKIDMLRQGAADDRDAMAMQKAAILQEQANEIRATADASANPQIKARGMALAAQRETERAAIVDSTATRHAQQNAAQAAAQQQGFENRIKMGELGVKQAEQKETARQHDLEHQDKLAEIGAKADERSAKTKADFAKNGVFDPSTANALLDPVGQKMEDAAKAIDQKTAAAEASGDVAAQQKFQKQADGLRAQAAEHAYPLEDKDNEVKNQLAGSQRLVNVTQRIRDALNDGSIFDRSTRSTLKTEADEAFTAWAELNKVKASSREYEVYKDAIGELDGLTATNIGKSPLLASLDALDTGARNTANTTLASRGIKTTWTPTAKRGQEAPVLSGKTNVELAADATPGLFEKLIGVDPFHPFTPPELRGPQVAENSGNTTPTGLEKSDDAAVMNLIGQYGSISPEDNKRVVSTLAAMVNSPRVSVVNQNAIKRETASVVAGGRFNPVANQIIDYLYPSDEDGGDEQALSDRKEAISSAVLDRIRGENPGLYKAVVRTLPEEKQKWLRALDAAGEKRALDAIGEKP